MTGETAQRPRPGPHRPVEGTRARQPGSVRRTTSADTTFPDGIGGRVVLMLRGRDLLTATSGGDVVLDELAVDLELEPWSGTIVKVDSLNASVDALAEVPFRGLRRRLSELFPDDTARRTLLFSALEDVAGAYLVSGYAGSSTGLIPSNPDVAQLAVQMQADVCIGWALDGPVIATLRTTGGHAVPFGPPAPKLEGDDTLGWHKLPMLPTPSVRRIRCTDVEPAPHGEALSVEHHFRDTYVGVDGEQVMHEYLVAARFDEARQLISIEVEPRVLPWNECPGAVGTAQRLVGVALQEIATRVTSDFAGVTTCTHLNSTLRTLSDAEPLSRSLSSWRSDRRGSGDPDTSI
jgi:hypothetical protein